VKVGYFMVTVAEVELRRLERGPPPGAAATVATATAATATAAAATTAAAAASAAAAATTAAALPDRGHVVTG
jgi:hypothetical protein